MNDSVVMDNGTCLSSRSTAALTEIPTILEMDTVTSVNGIPAEELRTIYYSSNNNPEAVFEYLKADSAAKISQGKIYINSDGKEILCFEGTAYEDDFRIVIGDDWTYKDRYFIILSRYKLDKKHDSGLSCFTIVMEFLGIPIPKYTPRC